MRDDSNFAIPEILLVLVIMLLALLFGGCKPATAAQPLSCEAPAKNIYRAAFHNGHGWYVECNLKDHEACGLLAKGIADIDGISRLVKSDLMLVQAGPQGCHAGEEGQHCIRVEFYDDIKTEIELRIGATKWLRAPGHEGLPLPQQFAYASTHTPRAIGALLEPAHVRSLITVRVSRSSVSADGFEKLLEHELLHAVGVTEHAPAGVESLMASGGSANSLGWSGYDITSIDEAMQPTVCEGRGLPAEAEDGSGN